MSMAIGGSWDRAVQHKTQHDASQEAGNRTGRQYHPGRFRNNPPQKSTPRPGMGQGR